MKKYFYFRTVADQDNDDAAADSLMVPVENLVGIEPHNSSNGTAANNLRLYFKSLNNDYSPTTTDFIIRDIVNINITAGKSKQVIEAIGNAIAGGVHTDGIIVVADDVTTTHETSSAGADETVVGKVLDSGITSCGDITIGAAWS
tara:strand:- start:57 stop:491 length:435 start_codon:yes stop_codon:yes gene_type:complete